MHCNWPTDHAIDHSSIGLNRLTIQLVFNEVSLFTFSKGTHGFDVTVTKNYLKTLSAAWTSPSGRKREHDLCAWAVYSNVLKVAAQVVQFSIILTVKHFVTVTCDFCTNLWAILCSLLWIDNLFIPTSSKPTGFKTVRQTAIQGRDHCVVTFVCTTLWEGFPGLHRYAERGRSLKS